MHINDTIVLVTSDSTTATLICSEPPRAISISNYALINIGCNCTVKAED